MRVSEIRVKQIRVNQGLGVKCLQSKRLVNYKSFQAAWLSQDQPLNIITIILLTDALACNKPLFNIIAWNNTGIVGRVGTRRIKLLARPELLSTQHTSPVFTGLCTCLKTREFCWYIHCTESLFSLVKVCVF